MRRSAAEIERQYGPFPGVDHVHGVTYDGRRLTYDGRRVTYDGRRVTYDGRHVRFASGDKLNALDPHSGKTLRTIDVRRPRR